MLNFDFLDFDACFSPVPPIAICNCKTSLIVLYIVFLSLQVVVTLIELVNMYILFLVHPIMLQISVSFPKFTPSNRHSVDSSTSLFHAVSHHNIHHKCKLHKSVISSQ